MYTFFTTATFWFIMGILSIGVFAGAKIMFEERGFEMNWWKWLLTLLWWVMLFFSIFATFTFMGEGETSGGLSLLALFGAVDLILSVGLWRLLGSGKKLAAAK